MIRDRVHLAQTVTPDMLNIRDVKRGQTIETEAKAKKIEAETDG